MPREPKVWLAACFDQSVLPVRQKGRFRARLPPETLALSDLPPKTAGNSSSFALTVRLLTQTPTVLNLGSGRVRAQAFDLREKFSPILYPSRTYLFVANISKISIVQSSSVQM